MKQRSFGRWLRRQLIVGAYMVFPLVVIYFGVTWVMSNFLNATSYGVTNSARASEATRAAAANTTAIVKPTSMPRPTPTPRAK